MRAQCVSQLSVSAENLLDVLRVTDRILVPELRSMALFCLRKVIEMAEDPLGDPHASSERFRDSLYAAREEFPSVYQECVDAVARQSKGRWEEYIDAQTERKREEDSGPAVSFPLASVAFCVGSYVLYRVLVRLDLLRGSYGPAFNVLYVAVFAAFIVTQHSANQ
jgi:hypothetical protein